jgi:hypothetical protein
MATTPDPRPTRRGRGRPKGAAGTGGTRERIVAAYVAAVRDRWAITRA